MSRAFLLQINTTRDCNLRCTHCYISTAKKQQSQTMTEEQLLKVFDELVIFLNSRRALEEYNLADVHIIGGEPTMLGLAFYQRTIPLIKEKLTKVKQQVKLSIVTNMVTDEAVEIGKLFDFVATSYEIDTRFVSVKGRPLPKLEAQWVENCRLMRESGKEVNVTSAVTQQVIEYGASRLLDSFFDKGFRNIHLGFFIPSGDGLTNIGTVFPAFAATSQFMIDATKWYMERRVDHPNLYVNPVESMIESIYRKEAMDDIVCPIIPGSLDIDWNGETVTCIEAGGEVDMDSLGNLFTEGMTSILESRKYIRERTKAIVPKPHCMGCDEMANCQSACGILHGYWNGRGECPGFKGFIKHIRHLVEVEGVLPKSAMNLPMSDWRAC
ncbi:radical SAM protein [Pseudomonas putida]|uniref:Radical SAM protein n=1 Tax=Pseudomonas putida TaxID=303 RepID=A0A8I1JK18_PSEPU|nr:radical SAM protein [Pseudomonas putida]MBI6882985.1 radical SAM protein [Pseudomonas putida]